MANAIDTIVQAVTAAASTATTPPPVQLLQLAVFGVEQLVTQAPKLYADIAALFQKGNPTAADWQALRDKIGAKSYFDYVPQSDLPRT